MPTTRHVGWLLAMLVGAVAASAPAHAAERWVIAIGNNVGLPDEVPLRYAERDAIEVATVLQRHGDVPASNALTILGEDAKTVRALLAVTGERIRATSPDALLVLFYSGHADARGLHMNGEILPFGELERMVTAVPAKLRVLVVDACRSGSVTRVKGVKPTREFEIASDDSLAARGLAVITSSAAGEDSYESDRLRASFFSHHLVTGLRGAADADGDQRVALDEVYNYVYDQTLKSSGQTRELQHPTFRFDVRGRGEVHLTTLADDTRGARLVLPEPGTYLLLEGAATGPVVAEATASRPGVTLSLAARRYFVQARYPSHYLEYDLRLQPGQTVSLSQLPARRVDYARLVRKGGGARGPVHNLRLHGGARGEVLAGQGVTPQVALGYGLDLASLSLGLQVRLAPPATLGATSTDGLAREHLEVGVALTADRFFDLPGVSIGIGLVVEATWMHQTFARGSSSGESSVEAPARDGLALGFGPRVAVQVPLGAGLQLELEGGPLAIVHRVTTLSQGAPRGEETRAAVTWSVSGGVAWAF